MQEPVWYSPLFKALTKPNRLLGVDYDYCIVIALASVLAFVLSNHFLLGLIFAPLHLLGLILGRIDSHIFRLLSVRANIGATRHQSLFKCQYYEAG
jgi:type IV secretory pathway VirB3-like protein